MAQRTPWWKVRSVERIFLLLITAAMAGLFFTLFNRLEKDFADVPQRLRDGTMMNLNDAKAGEKIQLLLRKGFYFKDQKDIDLVGRVIARNNNLSASPIDNTGELNMNRYNVSAADAFETGGENFKKRALLSRELLGFTGFDSSTFTKELDNPLPATAVTDVGLGKGAISGSIFLGKEQPAAGVLVRLRLIVPQDSVYSSLVAEVDSVHEQFINSTRYVFVTDSLGNRQLLYFTAYARTGNNGNFLFKGLSPGQSFEVLPLKPGYQFGGSQGVTQLDGDPQFAFFQSTQTIKLFSTKDFSNLKKEKAFIVRMPEEVMRWFHIIFFGFIGAFFLVHLVLSVRFKNADQLILPLLMVLTGLSFITLISLQDPLRDRFLAKSEFIYFCAGICLIIFMLLFNLRYLTTDSRFYRFLIFKSGRYASNGWPWALAAIGLLTATILFGTGPEGSGVKVNLLGFQPSEIVKFLVILFLAGFFTTNERFISEYPTWRRRLSFFLFALLAIVSAILLFLVLGDLGPAMVCCFTFIVLFSFSRGDFLQMAISVVLYVVSVWTTKNVLTGTAISVGILLLFMLLRKKQLSESTVMVLVIMSGFLLLDKVPYLDKLIPGPVQRLTDRKAIWEDPWNNEVFGGDQIANGIWAIATGGFTGQGAGEGFAKTIPEAHTDMILPSMGEEFGGTIILCIFILFLLYLHRSILIGRQTGTPLLFYICSGIGIGTFVQFVLIAGGSTGALPLSGVALPFMSYGGSSLLCNMLAAGFLLSASHLKGTPAQMKFITARQDRNLVPALAAAFTGIVLLSFDVSKYLTDNKKWVVEPALVADRSGARMYSYNPRISILMNKLQAGNLLDRKGRILATSHPEIIRQDMDSLIASGISEESLESLDYKRLSRYYPFGAQTFFWTGDANTGVFNGATNGYFAEYEHGEELRGFAAPATKFQVSAHRFREEKFLPQSYVEMTVSKRDYSALSSLLLSGINSKPVDDFKQRNRDVQLTIDAALQTNLQNLLSADDSLNIKRISVVVLEDNTGDVIASAGYPLPPVDNWDLLTLSEPELNKLPGWNVNSDIGFTHATQPGSTAKLVTALAAFNKLGDEAATKTIHVLPGDLIRVSGLEPDEAGYINIERAIVRSNNSFFIRLANEEQLQEEMGTLYLQAGMFLHGVGGYYYETDPANITQQNMWREIWRETEFKSVKTYDPNNIRRTRGKGVSGMAWGQGELVATPAAIARLASGISNGGDMMQSRYVMNVSGTGTAFKPVISLTKNRHYAELMTDYMKKQSAGKVSKLGIVAAGKTGTPERIYKGERINDGWYVFFAPKPNDTGHIVTCVRIENAKGSSDAVKLAGKYVVPLLLQRGYIKSFEPVNKATKFLQAKNQKVDSTVVRLATPDSAQNPQ